MATVKSVLRNAWKKFDQKFREEYARQASDDGLPNDEIAKYVFPAIFTVEGCTHKESRWVNNATKWDFNLENPLAAAEIENRLLEHQTVLEDLTRLKAAFRAKADELGASLRGRDPRTIARYAFDAALLYRQSEDSAFSEDDALRTVVVDQLGDEVRTPEQLKIALQDAELVNRVQSVLRSWTPEERASSEDEKSEIRDWEKLAGLLGSVWMGRAVEEHLRMPLAWDHVVAQLGSSASKHEWRAGNGMALCGHAMSSGERHPAVSIGGPTEGREPVLPLDRSLYRRLEGRFGSGSDRKGFPEFDVLLADVARRSLEPFSLNDPESRAAVVIAFFALQYVYDPDEDNEGGRFIPSPFVRQLRSTIFMRLRGARRRGGQSMESSGHRSGDSTPSDPRTTSVERQANALAEFQDAYMERLWTRVHNLELDSLRQGGGKKVHDWRALRAIMLDNAFKVGGDAWATGVKPPKAVSEVALAIGMSTEPSTSGLPIGALYAEFEATLAAIENVGDFLMLVQDLLDLEQLEARNGVLTEDEEDDRQQALADAEALWLQGRERLAEIRSDDGLDSPDLTLDDVLPLFRGDLGNGLPGDIE